MARLLTQYLHRMTVIRAVQDVLMVLAVVGIPLAVFLMPHGTKPVEALGPMLATGLGLTIINGASGFYAQNYELPPSQTLARAIVAMLVAALLAWVIWGLPPMDLAPGGQMPTMAIAATSAVVGWRVLMTHLRSRGLDTSTRVLVYGVGPAAEEAVASLRAADPRCAVVGYVKGPNETQVAVPLDSLLQHEGELLDLARAMDADEIIVALTERRGGSMPLRQLLDCKLNGLRVWDLNTHFEQRLGQLRLEYVKAGWLIFGEGFNQGAWRSGVKRVFDIVAALALLLPGLPLIALGALAVRLESRGSAFYRQERVGQHGRPFEVVKLRSMYSDAEKDGRPQWAKVNDSRITRVGRFIRKTRIDELPQLFNVLRGEMSLVGPRPERAYFVEQLTAQLPFFAVRQSVKPGITGWAQVRCDYGSSLEETKAKLQFDLYYVKNHSLFLDVLVMFETVAVVITGRGAR